MIYLKEVKSLAERTSPSQFTFLSVYLDTTSDGKGRRACFPFLKKRLAALRKRYEGRSETVKSLRQDADKVEGFLSKALSPSTRGVAVFACSGEGIFQAFPLPVSPKNGVLLGPGPALSPWVLLKDEYDSNILVVADSRIARFFVIRWGSLVETKELTTAVKPLDRRFERLGLAKPRMDHRISEKVEGHVRRIVLELSSLVRMHAVERLALAGDNTILSGMMKAMSPGLLEKVCTRLALDIRVPTHQVLRKGVGLFREAEEKEAQEKAHRLMESMPSGRGVAGTTGTLNAIEGGKAKELLLTNEFHEEGYWCSSCGKSFRGKVKPCSCGGESVAVDLRERAVALAVSAGLEVEFVCNSPELTKLGGIGAFLSKR